MTLLRLTLSIAVVIFFTLASYLLIALPLLLQEDREAASIANTSGTSADSGAATDPVSSSTTVGNAVRETALAPASGSRLLEIRGRVRDSRGQPIDDVLITEERYFFATRSDSDGRYRLSLDLPRQRRPILHFLRAGFAGKRLKLTPAEQALQQLDVVLADSMDTLRLSGWVGNDLGVALAGVRIEISALESDSEHNYYLTEFSDAQGNFVLEGVRANSRYRLTATLAPDYPVFSDPEFLVGSDSRHINIELKSLKFVDLGGMILNPEAAPVGDFEFYIKNLSTGVHSRRIVSDSSGYFSLQGFPLGEVRLSTRGAEFHKISGITLGEDNYSNLVLLVDRGDRYLGGWVSDENGIALEKAMVTLDAKLRDGDIETSSYRSQTTDSSGRFEFANVAAGNHLVTVYASGYDKLEIEHDLQNLSEQMQLRLTRSR